MVCVINLVIHLQVVIFVNYQNDLLAYWLIGLLAYWLIGLLNYNPEKPEKYYTLLIRNYLENLFTFRKTLMK